MFALLTHWKLRDGCPPQLQAAIEELTRAIESEEPGTLFYSVSLPGPYPPIGPPPEYAVSPEVVPTPPRDMNELVFFEIYRDDKAFSDHLRGAVRGFHAQQPPLFSNPMAGTSEAQDDLSRSTVLVRSGSNGRIGA